MIRAFFQAVTQMLELTTTEIRHGINLTEAVAADEFETQLRALTTTDEQRDDIRDSALMIAKAGMSAWDVSHLTRMWARGELITEERGTE